MATHYQTFTYPWAAYDHTRPVLSIGIRTSRSCFSRSAIIAKMAAES